MSVLLVKLVDLVQPAWLDPSFLVLAFNYARNWIKTFCQRLIKGELVTFQMQINIWFGLEKVVSKQTFLVV